MATKLEKQVMIGKIKGDIRTVDFTKMITEQQEFVYKAQRLSGSKPSKVEEAYINEQKAKLSQLEDIVKHWIWEAYADSDDVVEKTFTWSELKKNFEIEVLVKIK
jgi:hypothetical protein